ncbi:phage head-tail connector protein [Mesomycoplasma lagogenitalium]|uniref:Phage head-tail connector protein n=1 Tax=Mesomycoplasma lagogenitalium TaxID=171286 RepID=A0ABY8LTB6_9BACT|nr:phage head-tail connector protein [Mesomycoplasma lagogenitalium]WGI36486.1 phage head-tail connector protein [Mesomycoplasma lagogenitalium]
MFLSETIFEWLEQLKSNLAIADNERDELLLDYIEIARKNIWTQYYELELNESEEVPELHKWSQDLKTKLATLHLAAIYVSNPDINMETSGLIDSRMIFRILGDRINYGKK